MAKMQFTTRICKKCGQPFEFYLRPCGTRPGHGQYCSRACARADAPSTPLKDRFLSFVGQRTERGCILWNGPLRHGYGVIHSGTSKGRNLYAHRVAWELSNGPIPDGLHVLHRCDVKRCINATDHLFLGTHADNMADMVAKRRHPRGEEVPQAKLTALKVQQIRERYASGNVTQAALAIEYGVSDSHVCRIVNGHKWY
jgi:hypothetical protein